MKAIMYHYVRPHSPSLPYFRHLDIKDFSKQLDYFSCNNNFIDKYSFIESIRSRKAKKGILLTFDDGFKDHYKYVLPELKKRNLFGVFYIPTAPFSTGKLIDVHRIHLLLGKHGGKIILDSINQIVDESMLSHAHIEDFHKKSYDNQHNDHYTDAAKKMLNYFISYQYREQVLDKLMSIFYPEESTIAKTFYMSQDEILHMHKQGMIIGSHTENHPVMSRLSKQDQKQEIENSFLFLNKIIGTESLKTFCYPYGGFHSFTDETEALLNENNCLFSFNVEARDIDDNDLINRPQALPRYDCNIFPHGSCHPV